MRSTFATNLVLLLVLATARTALATTAGSRELTSRNVARDYFEEMLVQLMHHRRMFLDGFGNGTAALSSSLDPTLFDDTAAAGEARGQRKKLRQMNKTLIAIIMAYTLKFMFLIPTFVGTLILLKFTTALAGFFYALFAAVLGLDHHSHGH